MIPSARLTRRDFLSWSGRLGLAALAAPAACTRTRVADPVWVNDVHSRLNRTRVRRVDTPHNIQELADLVRAVARDGGALSVAGGRHAMGGQQFGTDTVLVDTTGLEQVVDFDAAAGQVEVGAGMQWPELIGHLAALQVDAERPWGIVQKQTGADRLCVGGALSANAHGRGLSYKPIVQDVEAFSLVDATGELRRCSRTENPDLFRLAIGGYGLFGVIATVRLRLAPRRKVERVVEVVDTRDVMERFESRIADGFLYGDCQYSTDLDSDDGLRKGVFSCYRPVADDTPEPDDRKHLSRADWEELVVLAHTNRAEAFRRYRDYYLGTSGQIYWSDTHQLSTYVDDYHDELVRRIGPGAAGGEMITEIYVPRGDLGDFLELAREDLRGAPLIYGTIRLIEKDDETFLPWAREAFACVIFNVHVTADRTDEAKRVFRALIDRGIRFGGGYFLTYHRWATRQQVETCYPRLPELLRLKREQDPGEVFQSDWYRHYSTMFEDLI